MVTYQPKPIGKACPSELLLTAFHYEKIRFNYFTSIIPSLKQRHEVSCILKIYKERIKAEHQLTIK